MDGIPPLRSRAGYIYAVIFEPTAILAIDTSGGTRISVSVLAARQPCNPFKSTHDASWNASVVTDINLYLVIGTIKDMLRQRSLTF